MRRTITFERRVNAAYRCPVSTMSVQGHMLLEIGDTLSASISAWGALEEIHGGAAPVAGDRQRSFSEHVQPQLQGCIRDTGRLAFICPSPSLGSPDAVHQISSKAFHCFVSYMDVRPQR